MEKVYFRVEEVYFLQIIANCSGEKLISCVKEEKFLGNEEFLFRNDQ